MLVGPAAARAVRPIRRRSRDRRAAAARRGGAKAAGGRRTARAATPDRTRRGIRDTFGGTRDHPPEVGLGRPGRVRGDDALRRFVRSLEARDASPHTRRSYEPTVRGYLAWLDARGTDWRAPGAPGAPRVPRGADRRARAELRRAAARRDPGVPPLRRPGRARAGRPVGRDRHAAPAAPPAAGAGGGAGRAPARRDRGRGRRGPSTRRSTDALALRDRALVETAYAAGLRISELAAADLGSLDLRRGELRVTGKGRKQRIGLLGRPARDALMAYLDEGRPALLARRPRRRPGRRRREVFLNRDGGPLGRPRAPRAARAAPPPGRPAAGRLAAHAPALVRHPPARRRRGPAGGPGAAGPREPRHDPGLHARLAHPAARRLPRRASAGPHARDRHHPRRHGERQLRGGRRRRAPARDRWRARSPARG